MNIDSDMWSRMYFENQDTKQVVCFECDNNVASALMKESFPKDTKFEYIEDYLSNKEDVSMLSLSWDEIEEKYTTEDNYEEEKNKFLKSIITKYGNDKLIFLNDFGTPLGSDIYDVEAKQDNLYPILFTKQRLYELKYKKTKFKNFKGEWNDEKINTFNWGILKDNKIIPEYTNEWQEIGKKREKLKRNPEVIWEFDKLSIFSKIKELIKW
jgi:hypothetical protein